MLKLGVQMLALMTTPCFKHKLQLHSLLKTVTENQWRQFFCGQIKAREGAAPTIHLKWAVHHSPWVNKKG